MITTALDIYDKETNRDKLIKKISELSKQNIRLKKLHKHLSLKHFNLNKLYKRYDEYFTELKTELSKNDRIINFCSICSFHFTIGQNCCPICGTLTNIEIKSVNFDEIVEIMNQNNAIKVTTQIK